MGEILQRPAAEVVEEEGASEGTIFDIKPLTGRDQRTAISGSGDLSDVEEEVDMQARPATGL